MPRRQARPTCAKATTFEQDHVAPDIPDVTIPLTPAYFAESALYVQSTARMVVCNDLGLQCPVSFRLGDFDQPVEQGQTDAFPAGTITYIDADLSDSRRPSGVRDGSKGGPADDRAIACAGNESPDRQMPDIPILPGRRIQYERRQAGRKPFAVD